RPRATPPPIEPLTWSPTRCAHHRGRNAAPRKPSPISRTTAQIPTRARLAQTSRRGGPTRGVSFIARRLDQPCGRDSVTPPRARRVGGPGRSAGGSRADADLLAAEPLEVRVDEEVDEALEVDRGRPAELLARLRGVADQVVELRRAAHERFVDVHVLLPVEPDAAEGDL